MLRKFLLSSALIGLSSAAFAADLPARVAPAPYLAAPMFTWTGFYVGLNAGAGWNNSDRGYSEFGFTPNTFGSLPSNNDAGFTGGAQAGYNMQFGSFVAGVEGDINYIDRGNGGSFVISPTATESYNLSIGNSNNWFGTVRGRLGFAFDRFLVFGTGGLAFGGKVGGAGGTYSATTTTVDNTDPLNPVTTTTTTTTALTGSGNSKNNVGWALGGGVEYAFSNAWSVKLEYLHVDLGDKTQRLFVNSTQGIDVKTDNKFDIVRAGVNFRF
jgi:outer membrane immunogenic protein